MPIQAEINTENPNLDTLSAPAPAGSAPSPQDADGGRVSRQVDRYEKRHAAKQSGRLPVNIEHARIVGSLGPCVLWRYIKGAKVPVNTSGTAVSALDPVHQMSFDRAAELYLANPQRFDGLGVVLTGEVRDDGSVLTRFDYDAKGDISAAERTRRQQVAQEHAELFDSYTETSVSGV
jgi:YD repeat-containing protein